MEKHYKVKVINKNHDLLTQGTIGLADGDELIIRLNNVLDMPDGAKWEDYLSLLIVTDDNR